MFRGKGFLNKVNDFIISCSKKKRIRTQENLGKKKENLEHGTGEVALLDLPS